MQSAERDGTTAGFSNAHFEPLLAGAICHMAIYNGFLVRIYMFIYYICRIPYKYPHTEKITIINGLIWSIAFFTYFWFYNVQCIVYTACMHAWPKGPYAGPIAMLHSYGLSLAFKLFKLLF